MKRTKSKRATSSGKEEFLKLFDLDADRIDMVLKDERDEEANQEKQSFGESSPVRVNSENRQTGEDEEEDADEAECKAYRTSGIDKKPWDGRSSQPSRNIHVTWKDEGLQEESTKSTLLQHDLASFLEQKKKITAILKDQIEAMVDRPSKPKRDHPPIEDISKQASTKEKALRAYLEDRIIEENVIEAALLHQESLASPFLGSPHACSVAVEKGISRIEQKKYHEALSIPLTRSRWRGPAPSSPAHRKYLVSTNLKGRQRLSPWITPENDPWSQQKKKNIGQEQLDKFLENAKKCAEVREAKVHAWKREMEETLKKNSKPQRYPEPAKLAQSLGNTRNHKDGVFGRLYDSARKPRHNIQKQAPPYPFHPIISPGTKKILAGRRRSYENTFNRISDANVINTSGINKSQVSREVNTDIFTFKPCLNDQTQRILQRSKKEETKDFNQRLLTSVLKYYDRISGRRSLTPHQYTTGYQDARTRFRQAQTDYDEIMHGDDFSLHYLTH